MIRLIPTSTNHNIKAKEMRGYRMLHTSINHTERELVILGIWDTLDSIINSFENEGERYEGLEENDMSRKFSLIR